METTLSRWRCGHLFDQGDRDLLLTEMVRPTVAAFLDQGWIDSFFFLRFDLGGPHLRLRLRAAAGLEADVERTVEAAARAFFARHPSSPPLPEEVLLRRTQVILAEGPGEADGTLHPDRSVRWPDWHPESDRYGGPALLPASLDFFAVSSARALALLADQSGLSRSRRLPGQLRLLAAQAWGTAGSAAELESLLAWALPPAGHPLEPFVARGDQAFAKSRDGLVALLRVEAAGAANEEMLYSEAARRLRHEIAAAPADIRARILKSQMHMTANRLGLSNPEEVHASRLLQRAAAELEDLRPHPTGPARAWDDLLPRAFAAWLHASGSEEPAA